MSSNPLLGNQAIQAAINSGNINIMQTGTMRVEVLELSNESKEAQLLHAEQLRKVEARSRARAIVVPTVVEEVKQKLRDLGHPATLFGENNVDRRERLRDVIASLELSQEEFSKIQELINQSSSSSAAAAVSIAATEPTKHEKKEVFYSPADEALIAVRQELGIYSFHRAQERLQKIRQLTEDPVQELQERQLVGDLYRTCQELALNSSEFGDDRPMSCVRYSSSGNHAATGSLTCNVKLWNMTNLSCTDTFRGHQERITSLAWHPDDSKALLASTSADGTCRLWNCVKSSSSSSSSSEGNRMDVENSSIGNGHGSASANASSSSSNNGPEVHVLKGHQGIVTACEFHPNGRLLGTASADFTWRLWDVETQKVLLLQDGHVKDCTAITFHPDGSLVLTADAAGVVLLWDLRSGQEVHVFQGHVQKITCASFNTNGFQAATGSLDNLARIWDLRQKKCCYCLPAHSNLISDLRYSCSGETLTTSSFDGTVKVWGTRDHKLLRSMTGHLGKVMGCDVSPKDERHIVSVGFDRTVKIYAHKDEF